MDNCPNCGRIRGHHSSILQGCNCLWQMQNTQEKCRIETVPAKGTLLPKCEWKGLTDEEIDLLEELYAPPVHPDFVNDASHCLELIRHVEAKLKQKNGYAEEKNNG